MVMKMETVMRVLDGITSKEVDIKLRHKDFPENVAFWFKIDDMVLCIDYLPSNYPELEVHIMHIEDARERLKEMIENEGWIVEKKSERF